MMDVQLPSSHQKWLAGQVSPGVVPSIDAAVSWAIEGMMALADDDLEWARPLLAAAEMAIAQGRGLEGTEFLARLDRKIEAPH
jgi:hypothetical protein